MASIHIASDHAGFTLKSSLILHLSSLGHTIIDEGTHSTASCDYPLYARKVCAAVLEDADCQGILICGTGVGMSITANRMPGIRAALCTSEFQARATRQHNNANVLCLGERVTGAGLAYAIVHAFLDTPFEGGRHQRRIDLIDGEY
ncbi:MAG: ribose 5-phosphate isomerase B [Desulfovibrionaceae bacterium]